MVLLGGVPASFPIYLKLLASVNVWYHKSLRRMMVIANIRVES